MFVWIFFFVVKVLLGEIFVVDFRFEFDYFPMEQREGHDFPPKNLPPPQPEATTAGVDFPARKLVRQLDFTGGASTMEQRQLVKLEQPPPALLPHLVNPPQMLFMTMQQPPAPPPHPSIRPPL